MTAPRLPEDMERALTEAIGRAASIGYDEAPDDKHYSGNASLDLAIDRAMESDKTTALRAAIAAHVAPPVSASFEDALTGLDYEVTHHPDKMVTTYAIVGLDDVRAAHAEAVRVAVEAERAACLKACKDLIDSINHDGECPMLVVHAYEVHGAEKCIAAICARGAKS